MLSPIHALLGEEFQDWALPAITARLDVHSLLALRATCKDGRRAATAEYDPVEAHQLFNGRRPVILKKALVGPFSHLQNQHITESMGKLVRNGHLRAYQQTAFAFKAHFRFHDAARLAAMYGHIPILNWLRNEHTPTLLGGRRGRSLGEGCELCNTAAEYGHLETLKWLRTNQRPFHWGERIWSSALVGGLKDQRLGKPQPDHRPFIAVLDYALAQKCPGHDCSPRYIVSELVDSVADTLETHLVDLLEEFSKPRRLRKEDDKKAVDRVAAFVDWFRPMLPEDQNEQLADLLASTRRALPRPINARPPRWC